MYINDFWLFFYQIYLWKPPNWALTFIGTSDSDSVCDSDLFSTMYIIINRVCKPIKWILGSRHRCWEIGYHHYLQFLDVHKTCLDGPSCRPLKTKLTHGTLVVPFSVKIKVTCSSQVCVMSLLLPRHDIEGWKASPCSLPLAPWSQPPPPP